MLTPQQHALRKTGITSTDSTRLAGESPHGGPCDVYRDKITDAPPSPPTLPMRIGQYLEPLVLSLIVEEFGLPELKPGRTVQHANGWALSTPDGFVDGWLRGCLEAKVKTVLFKDRDLWLDPVAPPPFVHVQSQWHMSVSGQPVCFVGALLGATPRFWIVEDDPGFGRDLFDIGHEFHEKHVLARRPPAPDGSEGARKMLKAIWPHARKSSVVKASANAERAARAYFEAVRTKRSAEAAESLAKQELMTEAGEFERIQGDGWRLVLAERDAVEVPAHTRPAYRHFDLREVQGR